MEEELPALLERGIPVVCVLVRPCLWDMEPGIKRVKWPLDPGRDRPLSLSADPEGVIVRICRRIDQLLPTADAGDHVVCPSEPAVPAVRLGGASSRPGRLDGVPRPPLPTGNGQN